MEKPEVANHVLGILQGIVRSFVRSFVCLFVCLFLGGGFKYFFNVHPENWRRFPF